MAHASMPVPQPPQYQCTMHRGWSWLREQWDLHGGSIAGHVGFQAVSALSARLSHPPVPIFMYLLAALGTLSNGASINVWGSPMPIAIWVLNVNYSQTRKSQLTALMESLCSKADAMAEELWGAVLKTKQAYAASSARAAASEETDCEQDGDTLQSAASRGKHRARRGSDADNSLEEPLQIWSVAYLCGTLERCKQRCAGDFHQVRAVRDTAPNKLSSVQADQARSHGHVHAQELRVLAARGLPGRLWFSQALVFDEAYDFLQDLALLDAPGSRKSHAETQGQTPAAGWANRLMQTGQSTFETKTMGVHGGKGAPAVSTSVVGNIHSAVAVEMARGIRGDHGCATRMRMFLVSGEPVQPHARVAGCCAASKQKWCLLPRLVQTALGLEQHLTFPQAAQVYFQDELMESQDASSDVLYFPDERGWQYTLPDGVETAIRLARRDHSWDAQWCLGDRDFDIPAELSVYDAADRFVRHFRQSHRPIGFHDDAAQAHNTYSNFLSPKALNPKALKP